MSEDIEGTVERITYHNDENGYTIARLLQKDGGLCTIVGQMAGVSIGESLRLYGAWSQHPQYGTQFKVERYQTILPATVEGIRRYLGSGLIKGIGPVTAKRIVRRFGLETLRVIEEEPARLREALGVGPKRIAMIQAAWEEQKSIKDVMVFLQSHDVPANLAVKIYKHYRDQSLQVLQDDPYRLARDIYGIGFVTADRIARRLGLPHDSPQRIMAGVSYVLGKLADEGHVYSPESGLVERCTTLLEVESSQVREAVDSLTAQRITFRERLAQESVFGTKQRVGAHSLAEEPAVYLAPFYHGEVGIAAHIDVLSQAPTQGILDFASQNEWDRALARIEGEAGIRLAPAQAEAVRLSLTHKVSVLTGGPGTGKTTTVRALLAQLNFISRRVALAAPTGRAAKRMTELCGHEAKTIHRLLEYSPQESRRFGRNADRPLDVDMLIVDEASMLDVLLTYHLLAAIPPGAHLLLVGDIDQLPSVGAGNVLHDIIRSESVPVTRLNTIYRQASDSWIIENAHRINAGQMPLFPKNARDFFLFPTEDPERAADLVVELLKERIPKRFGLDPLQEIQVLCPMHRGIAGVSNLNNRLQEALNSPEEGKPERRAGGIIYRVGDRVMGVRNNYDKDVFNGDIGIIRSINLEDHFIQVEIDGRRVPYEFSELDDLVLAYAISVHKSQGSEYPAVVIPLLTQHRMMLQRNLLYTAVTRARQLVVIVGSRRAISLAIRNSRVAGRYSGLARRLRESAKEDYRSQRVISNPDATVL